MTGNQIKGCGCCSGMRAVTRVVSCCVDERYGEASGIYGVIQSAQHSGRTCRVMWMRPQPSAESA